MKIEKIVIQNLNSIEEAEIDFSSSILAKEPLFLICGETGSGKSTILDAITLALYDKASRYESVKNNETTENGKSDTKSLANILRKGKYDCKSELYFSIKNTNYIATWSLHKTKTDKYDNSNRRKLEIVQDGVRTVISSKINEVNKKIEELIGLTYDQFIRSVMLAQGDFNTFLVSQKKEQSEILEMLTGTEVYSRIAEAVKNRKNEANQSKKEIETIYNNIKCNILSDNELKEIEDKKTQLEKEKSETEILIRRTESYLAWHNKNNQIYKELSESKSVLDYNLSRIESEEYKNNRAIIDDYFASGTVRNQLRDSIRYQSDLQRKNSQHKEDEKLFSSLLYLCQKEKDNKELLCKNLSLLNTWMDNNPKSKLIYENYRFITELLRELTQISKNILSEKNILDEKIRSKNNILLQLNELTLSLEKVRNERNDAENLLQRSISAFDINEHQRLITAQQELNNERNRYQERSNKLLNVKNVLEQYLYVNNNIKKEEVEYDKLTASLKEKKDLLISVKNNFEIRDKEFQKQKNMVEDWAKNMRQKLTDGEPCPVCGSRQHYFENENVVNSLFNSLESEWSKSRLEYEKAKDEFNKAEIELNTISKRITLEKKNAEVFLTKLNELCSGQVIFETERIVSAINKCNDKTAECDKKIAEINEELKRLSKLKNEIDIAQKNKTSVDAKFNLIDKQYQDKQKEYQELEMSINTLKNTLEEHELQCSEKKDSLEKYFKVEEWELSWQEVQEITDRINSISAQWQEKMNLAEDSKNRIQLSDNIVSQSYSYLSDIIKLFPDWENIEHTIVNQSDSIVPQLASLYERCKSYLKEVNELEEKILSLNNIIAEFTAVNPGINKQRLLYLNEIEDIQKIIEINKSFDDEVTKSQNTFKIKSEEFEQHQHHADKPQEDDTAEVLNVRLIQSKNAKEQNENQLSDLKMKLSLNEQNLVTYNRYKTDLEEKSRLYQLWEQLAKAIGTTDTDNFRDVAQAYTMSILLDRANYYMRQLSNRYELCNYPDSLAIMVRDMEMGSELRAATSLSGGETFLVSLALALGLTSLNDEHFDMDMLFIDEGFGTLDSDSLDMVMTTLENLHILGKRVGIISHVDTLKERIPAQIQLIREGKSLSKVLVTMNQ